MEGLIVVVTTDDSGLGSRVDDKHQDWSGVMEGVEVYSFRVREGVGIWQDVSHHCDQILEFDESWSERLCGLVQVQLHNTV